MVDSGTKQSKFCWTFWYQIRKIVFFGLGRLWFSAPHMFTMVTATWLRRLLRTTPCCRMQWNRAMPL